jgi:hypothetical protein
VTIVFTDVNGNSWNVKDIRPITVFTPGVDVALEQGTLIDELISRREYYGKNTEDLTWAVVDNNIEALAEANFDLTLINKLNLPVVGSF